MSKKMLESDEREEKNTQEMISVSCGSSYQNFTNHNEYLFLK